MSSPYLTTLPAPYIFAILVPTKDAVSAFGAFISISLVLFFNEAGVFESTIIVCLAAPPKISTPDSDITVANSCCLDLGKSSNVLMICSKLRTGVCTSASSTAVTAFTILLYADLVSSPTRSMGCLKSPVVMASDSANPRICDACTLVFKFMFKLFAATFNGLVIKPPPMTSPRLSPPKRTGSALIPLSVDAMP